MDEGDDPCPCGEDTIMGCSTRPSRHCPGGDWLAPTPSRDEELAALRTQNAELKLTIRGMSSTIAQQAQYISRMT